MTSRPHTLPWSSSGRPLPLSLFPDHRSPGGGQGRSLTAVGCCDWLRAGEAGEEGLAGRSDLSDSHRNGAVHRAHFRCYGDPVNSWEGSGMPDSRNTGDTLHAASGGTRLGRRWSVVLLGRKGRRGRQAGPRGEMGVSRGSQPGRNP